jgi:nicotinamide-nucleotide amidase
MRLRESPPERSEPRWVTALREHGWTVAVAESMTAGLLAARLAAKPGSGDVFAGGIVAYHTALKNHLLGVTANRVISAECALEMAQGVTRLCNVDVGLAITGVAGPDTQEDQPIGLVYSACVTPAGCTSRQWSFPGDAYEVRTTAVDAAIALLVDHVTAAHGRVREPGTEAPGRSTTAHPA